MKRFPALGLCLFAIAVQAKAATVSKITSAETKAQAIIEQLRVASNKRRTMKADFSLIENGRTRYKGTLNLMKPNLFRATYNDIRNRAAPEHIEINDGNFTWLYPYPFDDSNKYLRSKLQVSNEVQVMLPTSVQFPILSFYDVCEALQNEQLVEDPQPASEFKFVGQQQWNNATYRVLQLDKVNTRDDKTKYHSTTWIYVGSDDIVRRQVVHLYVPNPKDSRRNLTLSFAMELFNVKLDASPGKADFQWMPPQGASEWKGTAKDLMKQYEARMQNDRVKIP